MGILNILFGQQKAKIGSITIDASVEETHESSADLTENPVEEGAKITDHVQLKPNTLTINGVISDTPITFALLDDITGIVNTVGRFLGKTSRSVDAYNKLVELQKTREPFKVVTGLKVYSNMILTNLSVNRTASTANAIHFTATMQEIRIAKTSTTGLSESIAPDAKDIASKTKDAGSKVSDTAKGTIAGANVDPLKEWNATPVNNAATVSPAFKAAHP